MKNQALIEKLNQISEVDNSWQEDVIFYEKNKSWLDFSAEIAIKILRVLRQNREEGTYPTSQKDLAEKMGISPQQVNKIVRGSENLTFETIFRIQNALNIQLIELVDDKYIKTSSITDVEIAYISTNDGGYVTNTKQVTDLPQIDKRQAGNTSYAMAA
jgi:transcriptional regulator with XRE-family HTH domain